MQSIKHFDGPFWAFVVTATLALACAGLIGTALVGI
jgi:hypothetical protein